MYIFLKVLQIYNFIKCQERKDLAKSLKVDIGQKFRILTKPFENDVIRIMSDTLEVNGEEFIYFDTGLLSQLMFGYHNNCFDYFNSIQLSVSTKRKIDYFKKFLYTDKLNIKISTG